VRLRMSKNIEQPGNGKKAIATYRRHPQ
jgi:hypothetical protein